MINKFTNKIKTFFFHTLYGYISNQLNKIFQIFLHIWIGHDE